MNKIDELLERLDALIARQKDERGDMMYLGEADPAIGQAAASIRALRDALGEIVDACRNDGRGNTIVNDRIVERCEEIAVSALEASHGRVG